MKDIELLIKQRDETAKNIKELMDLMWGNSDDKYDTSLYIKMTMLRCIDWALDDSDLNFDEYCLKTNMDISKEFGIIM